MPLHQDNPRLLAAQKWWDEVATKPLFIGRKSLSELIVAIDNVGWPREKAILAAGLMTIIMSPENAEAIARRTLAKLRDSENETIETAGKS